ALPILMTAWGVEMVKGKVVGDRKTATRVQAQRNGQPVVTEYVLWFGIEKDGLAKNEVITGELEQLRFLTPGALQPIKGAKTTFTPLAQTSDQSMLIDLSKAKAIRPDPITLLNEFKPDKKHHVLAARITGPVKSAFDAPPKPKKDEANKDKDKDKKEAPLPPHLKESKGPISVIVVADVDMLADRVWLSERNLFGQRIVMPFANNADFAINAIENFSGSQALISLRGRGIKQRSFEVVDQLQRAAEIRYRQTEQSLQKKLEDVEKKLSGIQGNKKDRAGNVLLTKEQQELVKKFRSDIIAIRSQLREVQHALRKDIDTLETWLKAINIAGVPILITIIAIAVAVMRRRRSGRRGRPVSDVRT
ncbi:MAG: ABC transporter, partial [Rhodospirillales bacterium]